MSTGIERIAAERKRQVEEEGYDAEHDLQHADSTLAFAAACYAAPGVIFRVENGPSGVAWEEPWPTGWYRRPSPHGNSTESRLRDLEKAGALIAAEIDRIVGRGTWDPLGSQDGIPPLPREKQV